MMECIADFAFPMVLTGLLLYSRSMISMLFLGRLGELALAGGSLAIGFANITGYSVLSGLAMGMEPICGQAFGAKRFKLLGLARQRTVILLLLTSVVILLLWLNMKKILLLCGQEEDIATEAHLYILYSLPDLIAQSILHPLRIYLLSQSITLPLTFCDTLSIVLHVPINYLLVSVLGFGIRGIALSAVWTNFNLVGSLIIYIVVSGVHRKTWNGIATTVSHQNGLNHGVTDADINIPVIDLQHLSGGDQCLREETSRRVSVACRECGSFQVLNHGMSHELMPASLRKPAKWPALPPSCRSPPIPIRPSLPLLF